MHRKAKVAALVAVAMSGCASSHGEDTGTGTGAQTPGVTPATSAACVGFTDMAPNDPFSPYVACLAGRGVVNGYSDFTFRPNDAVTRGQLAKIVANSAGYSSGEPPAPDYTFADVPRTQAFWLYVERAAAHGIISGYACGGPGEPCDSLSRKYFRPSADVTRSQTAKIVTLARNYQNPLPPDPAHTFADVPRTDPFWPFVERAAANGLVSGYACGGPGEPCDDQHRPYFRPYNGVTRGQATKMVSLAFFDVSTCCGPGGCAVADINLWPNCQSAASSDPWIPQHHGTIREMRPQILAINLVDSALTTRFAGLVSQTASGVREGSRYHGYSDVNAQPAVNPQIVRLVDLTDHGNPPPGWNHLNSSHYPIKCSQTSWYQFDYSQLFGQSFADAYGFADPQNPTHNFTLNELTARGMVHEVWVFVDGGADSYTCPNGVHMNDFQMPEVLEFKQKYDANGQALPGQFDTCAGNGCFDQSDVQVLTTGGRTLRVLYINAGRGPGCALHSLGHGFESMGSHSSIPYLTTNFAHFANFDLQTRFNTPFTSWYACSPTDSCVTYTGIDSLSWQVGASTGVMNPYNQGCGNVHFPANGRTGYDYDNPSQEWSTCEHYGLHDGPGGADAKDVYTSAKANLYEPAWPDCGGGWQVYWRQSFPGYQNRARDAANAPMKSWWPFLYY